jgi:phosphotransferase system  glucose/maltose/N-acetylglucosamine-specific IIC component
MSNTAKQLLTAALAILVPLIGLAFGIHLNVQMVTSWVLCLGTIATVIERLARGDKLWYESATAIYGAISAVISAFTLYLSFNPPAWLTPQTELSLATFIAVVIKHFYDRNKPTIAAAPGAAPAQPAAPK